jgi:tRNA (cmo5U34)-methyltransferase
MTGGSLPHLPKDYDVQINRTIPYYDQFIGETINLLLSMDRPPTLWLDTGCGTGTIVRAALDIFPDTRFLLADPSEKMLEQAKRKLEGLGRVRFLEPSGTQDLKGMVTERPDVITAIQCHHYLSQEERIKAVGACFDILAKGGTYVTFENVRPLTNVGVSIGKKNWGHYQKKMGKSEVEVDAHLARFDHEYFPITVEEHLGLYRNAGFSTVELFWYSYMQAGFYCIK